VKAAVAKDVKAVAAKDAAAAAVSDAKAAAAKDAAAAAVSDAKAAEVARPHKVCLQKTDPAHIISPQLGDYVILLDRNSYIENFPRNVPLKMAQGFLATAAINLVFNKGTYRTALLRGSLAALISLVEAVTRPIIKAIFPNTPLAGMIIQIVITPLSIEWLLEPRIGLSNTRTPLIPFIAWFILNHGFYGNNEGMAEVI
jgi:hypothetical protein